MADNPPKNDAPHGSEPYDLRTDTNLGALSNEQQAALNQYKMKTRTENEKYLRNHPEVECLVAGFLGDIFRNRPDDVREFAAEYFTDPSLPEKLQTDLEERQERLRQNKVIRKL